MVKIEREKSSRLRYVQATDKIITDETTYQATCNPYVADYQKSVAFNIAGQLHVLTNHPSRGWEFQPIEGTDTGHKQKNSPETAIPIDAENVRIVETVNVFEERREHVLELLNELTQYPSIQYDKGPAEADLILKSWMEEGRMPRVGNDTEDGFEPSSYFRVNFFGLMLGQGWITKDEAELLKAYKELRGKNMPSNLPADGSKGQWRAAMNHKLQGVEWLLGLNELDKDERRRVLELGPVVA